MKKTLAILLLLSQVVGCGSDAQKALKENGNALARLVDTAEVYRDDNGDIKGMNFYMDGKIRDADLVHLKRLPKLTSLGFEKTKVGDAGLVHLQTLTNLNGLTLTSTAVSDAGLIHLMKMTNLRGLYLQDTQVTDVGLLHLKEMPGLKRLWFSTTHVSRAAVAKLNQALPNCRIFHNNDGLSP